MSRFFRLYICLAVIFCPSYAWAYLDPGTGNILVYLVVSLVGAGAFFLKNIYYRLRSMGGSASAPVTVNENRHQRLALFSEGRAHWGTFKPVIERLLERGYDFTYLTLDVNDPALLIDNPHMDSRYLGHGTSAFAKAAGTRARVMLSTTPNIGTPGFPLPVPRHVRCLAYVFHGVGGMGAYMKHALDNYQAIMMNGPYAEPDIRRLEKLRGLAPKECVLAGLPYLDTLLTKAVKKTGPSSPPVILAAPAWGYRNFLSLCGVGFLARLAESGYEVILRPHPQSLKSEPELIDRVRAELSSFENISFDLDPDGSASLARADLMIADISGVRFDFALLYSRPVISINAPMRNVEQYEVTELERFWDLDVSPEIGRVLRPDELDGVVAAVKELLAEPEGALEAFRDKYVANFGHAGAFIADWLIDKANALASEY